MNAHPMAAVPREVDLPEFRCADRDFDSSRCARAIAEQGAVLLRGAIQPQVQELFRKECENGFRWLETAPDRCPGQSALYQNGSNFVPGDVDDAYGTSICHILPVLRRSAVLDVASRFLGSPAITAMMGSMLVRRVTSRRWNPDKQTDPVWHQDAALVEQSRMVTCWIPLTPCGVTAPSLKVAVGKVDRLHPRTELPDKVANEPGARVVGRPMSRAT